MTELLLSLEEGGKGSNKLGFEQKWDKVSATTLSEVEM